MKRVWIFFGLILFPSLIFAANSSDYEFQSEDWNGESRFLSKITSRGYVPELEDDLDFSTLKPTDTLMIFYPKQELDVDNLTAFVVDGGRILLADDFGRSEGFLKRLDIHRVSADLSHHRRFYHEKLEMPVFTAEGAHPLLKGVQEVVANHPTAILNEGGPVLKYDKGLGFVYDMNLGKGKVIVVADPSMFINQMILLKDNERFADNIISYLCLRDSSSNCTIRLFSKDFEQRSTYQQRDARRGRLLNTIAAVNQAMGQVGESVSPAFLFYFTILLLLGIAIYFFAILPVVPTQPYSKYIKVFSDSVPWPQSEFDWNLSRFGDARNPRADILPMAILKELFERIFLEEVGFWPSRAEERPNIEGLATLFSKRFLMDLSEDNRIMIERDLIELLSVLANTPPRHRVFLENDTEIHKGDLQKYHAIAIELITIMGRRNDYEQFKWGSH